MLIHACNYGLFLLGRARIGYTVPLDMFEASDLELLHLHKPLQVLDEGGCLSVVHSHFGAFHERRPLHIFLKALGSTFLPLFTLRQMSSRYYSQMCFSFSRPPSDNRYFCRHAQLSHELRGPFHTQSIPRNEWVKYVMRGITLQRAFSSRKGLKIMTALST